MKQKTETADSVYKRQATETTKTLNLELRNLRRHFVHLLARRQPNLSRPRFILLARMIELEDDQATKEEHT